MSFPRTTLALRAALDERGFRARKRHGQNFLTDAQAVDAIVRDAGVGPADRVIEVGTGPGLLTYALAATGATVVTFEIDPEIQSIARSLADWPSTVSFRIGDALAGKHVLSEELRAELAVRAAPPGRTRVVSNLPYGSGTPILLGLLTLPSPPDELVVMLQEEVAEKLLAPPDSSAYGAPSVVAELSARGEILRRFGPQVFWPRPRVRSAVVRLVPRLPPPLAPAEQRPFADLVTALFSHRRKVLPQSLRHGLPDLPAGRAEAALAQAEIAPTARVQEIEPERLVRLFRALGREASGGGRGGYGGPPSPVSRP